MTPHSHLWDNAQVSPEFATVYLRLGLELKTKTQTQSKPHGPPTEITDLLSGPGEAQVLTVLWQKEFTERQSEKVRSGFIQKKHSTERAAEAVAEGPVQPQNVLWLLFM